MSVQRHPGGVSLEFVNTASFGRSPDVLVERESFVRWMLDRRDPALEAPSSALSRVHVTHMEALRLRSAIRRLFEHAHAGQMPDAEALYLLNRGLEHGARISQLRHDTAGFSVVDRFVGDSDLLPLAPIALDAAEVIRNVDTRRLRECAARDCRKWFVDTSKGGRRRWCSMSLCGNRAKAARHRRRHAAAP